MDEAPQRLFDHQILAEFDQSPEPLCVDLLQEQRTIRRFCRPFDVSTGLGEFVEKKI